MISTNSDINIIKSLPLVSYNSTGWGNNKIDFINTILISHGILVCALQEHFQLKENLYKLECFDQYESFSLPAYKNNNIVSSGRPMGGLSLIYNQCLSKYASRLTVPQSRRVQGLKLCLPNSAFLFINSYFPNDPGNNNGDDVELLDTLQDIKYLLDKVDENCTVVILGDLNTDFSRNTAFVQTVKNFFQENNLVSAWSKFDCDFTYYQERVVRGRTVVSKSTIDHFGVKFEDLNSCVEATPLHLASNFSFHAPIYLKIECANLILKPSEIHEKLNISNKPMWYKASSSQVKDYAQDLHMLINNIIIDVDVLCCRNAHCKDITHIKKLDDLSHDLLDCITTAVRDNIPSGANSAAHNIPGWNSYVQPFKDDSIFWKAIWVSAGRPVDTELHRVYRNCRQKYKLAIKKVKKHESDLRKNKFLSACLDNKVSDILTDIKAMRSKGSSHANVIDGHTSSESIANHFKEIYTDIYNTHTDRDDLDQFIQENDNMIGQSDVELVDKISPTLVKNIILNFSNNKNDSVYDWKSDALKAGADFIVDPLCDLLRSLIIHGHIPKIFLLCSLVPIVKNNNASKLSSSNYRLIAISSLLLKVFDHILIELSQPNLKPSIYQYGFQSGISTGMCTWSVLETINYFRNRDTPVFLCLMDLTKAFDLVKLSLLFKKLSQKVSPILLRFLIFSYLNQECVVAWNGVRSSSFTIANGVRQGAVLSPALFNVYIDDVFHELSQSGFGCKINSNYFGCVGYADDIALLAPSRAALQEMINICAKYFYHHGTNISTDPNPSVWCKR